MTQNKRHRKQAAGQKQQMVSQTTKSRVSCSKQGANRRTRSTIRTKRPQERFAGRDDQTSAGRNDPESRTDRIASDRAVPKNIEIEELAGTVEELNKDIAGLNEVTASQKTTIEEQDSQLNVVWFCIADMKQLKEARIVEGNGLFKPRASWMATSTNRHSHRPTCGI